MKYHQFPKKAKELFLISLAFSFLLLPADSFAIYLSESDPNINGPNKKGIWYFDGGGGGDSTPPNISFDSPTLPYYTNASTVNITGHANERLSYIRINSINATLTNNGYNFQFQNLPLLIDAENLSFEAADLSNNIRLGTVAIIRDTLAPQITLIDPQQNAVVNESSIEVQFQVFDLHMNLFAVLIDGNFASTDGNGNYTGSVWLGSQDGDYTFTITAWDWANNYANLDVTVTLALPWFLNATGTSGLVEGYGYGLTADIDSDQDRDVLFLAYSMPRVYLNNGNATFQEVTAASGLAGLEEYFNGATLADVDNDNDPDLFFSAAIHPNRLFLNDGLGHFADTTIASGVGQFYYAGGTAADYNRDGYLDIAAFTIFNFVSPKLYRNNGDLTFSDVHSEAGISRLLSKGFFLDFDGDGKVDLIGRELNTQQLIAYRNNGDNTFTDSTASVFGSLNASAYASLVSIDYDNDGDHDLACKLWNDPPSQDPFVFLRNDGGSFVSVDAVSDASQYSLVDVAFGDFDRDGWSDALVLKDQAELRLFLNKRDGTFEYMPELSMNLGPYRGEILVSDFNGDGRLDAVVGGDQTVLLPSLLLNATEGNHSLLVQLNGTTSNRRGVGALLTLNTSAGIQARQVGLDALNPDVQSEPFNYFGIPEGAVINSLQIRWPSGIVQTLTNVAPDQTLVVTEPATGNHAPVLTLIGNQMANEGEEITFTVSATDEDPADVLVFLAGSLPAGSVFEDHGNRTATFTWTPDFNQAGTYTNIRFEVRDSEVVDFENISIVVQEQEPDFWFSDVTASSGLQSIISYSLAVGDIDNDGDQDIDLLKNGNDFSTETHRLYRNNGNVTFTDITMAAGVEGDGVMRTNASAFGDFDNDGHLDLFIWSLKNGSSRFYHSNGDGTFTDMTDTAGLSDLGGMKGTAAADYDQDGDLDIFAANSIFSSRLYRNEGNLTFTDVVAQAGLVLTGHGAVFVDFDGDTDQDLYIVGQGLFRNNSDGTFTDVSDETETTPPFFGWGVSFGDYDRDGDFDFFLTGIGGSLLYRNDGGVYSVVDVGIPQIGYSARSSVLRDFDQDGWLDIVFTKTSAASVFFRNRRDGTFEEVGSLSGLINMESAYDMVAVDMNQNGTQDIVLASNDFSPTTPVLFLNTGSYVTGGYLIAKLVGAESNRDGIGAVLRLTTSDGVQIQQAGTASTTSHSQSQAVTHFGLGNATVVDSLEIRWPSGIVQTLTNITPNQTLTVAESGGTGDLPPGSPAEALDRVIQNVNQILDLKADTQISTSLNGAAYTADLYGTFFYLPPDRSRMEYYNEPARVTLNDIFIANAAMLSRVNPETMAADTTDLTDFANLSSSAFLGLDYLHRSSDFIAEHSLSLLNVNEAAKTCDVEAAPAGSLSALYEKLVLTINYEFGLVMETKLMRDGAVFESIQVLNHANISGARVVTEKQKTWYMSEGNLVTHEEWSNVEVNSGLSPSLFEV